MQPADDVNDKLNSRLPRQDRGYLPNFRASPLLACTNFYCFVNKTACVNDLPRVAA